MKVKKSNKRTVPPPADCARLIQLLVSEQDLLPLLEPFQVWKYPRGDLHAWIGVLDRFDTILEDIIETNQIKTHHPKSFDTRLLLNILRVQKLLLENCTNRKLFASYDRLCDLLLSSDASIVRLSLLVLLRPAQQYIAATPVEKDILQQIKARLLILARAEGARQDMNELASDNTLVGGEKAQITFYRNGVSTTVSDVDEQNLVQLADEYEMPENVFLDLQYRVRWITALVDARSRHDLLAIRLLSIANLWLLTPESSSSALFLYQPNIILQLTSLLSDAPLHVQYPAVFALDACCRYRAKLPEVLTALGANLTHGPLIELFRRTTRKLIAKDDVPFDLVDAIFGLLALVSLSLNHSHLLLGAGVMDILLELLTAQCDKRENYIPRAAGLVDAFASGSLSQSEGMNFLVGRVRAEVESLAEPQISVTVNRDSAIFYATSPLKAIMRSIYRIMHAGSDGSRNLVDTDLPKSIKCIFRDSTKYGPRVFTQAIHMMSAFVHNEPTSLSILQELRLPQTLIENAEQYPPESYEVMSALTTAIGAACLNNAGLEYMTAHLTVVENLVAKSVALDFEHGQDQISQMGSALDELARHQPAMRPTILQAVLAQLRTAVEEGAKFIPSDDERRDYSFDPVHEPRAAGNKPLALLLRNYKLLEGVLNNSAMCKEFLDDGLDILLRVPDLPCVPVAFSKSDAHIALSRVYRVMVQQDQVKVVERVLNAVRSDLDANAVFCQGSWDNDLARLPGLAIRLSILSDVLSMTPWQGRSSTALLRSLQASPSFLSDLSLLHRSSLQHHAETSPETVTIGEDNADWPRPGPRFIATRLHAVITKLFKSTIKLLTTRRADTGHRKEADKVAKMICTDLIGHIRIDNPKTTKIALGLTTLLLFDDRAIGGKLHQLLLSHFREAGGFNEIARTASSILDAKDSGEVSDNLRMLLLLVTSLVSSQAVEDPADLLQLRLEFLPILYRIWNSVWLGSCSLAVARLAVKAFLEVMTAEAVEDEEPAPEPIVITPMPIRAPAPLDPTRIEQLVDMGFARTAAETALSRARGNVAAAADLILSMPHLFVDLEEPDQDQAQNEVIEPNVSNDSQEVPETSPLPDPVPATDLKPLRAQFETLRASYKPLLPRAMELLDAMPDLAFDLILAFANSHDSLLEWTLSGVRDTSSKQSEYITARLRMAAIALRHYRPTLNEQCQHVAMEIINALPEITDARPDWVSAFFMFVEAVLAATEVVLPTRLGDQPGPIMSVNVPPYTGRVIADGEKILADPTATRDEILATLRVLAVCTRRTPGDALRTMLRLYKEPSSRISGCHPYIAIILRHYFEDHQTLVTTMRRDVRRHLTRHSVTDVAHFIIEQGHSVHRNPQAFIEATEAECVLVDPTPAQSVYHIRLSEQIAVTEDDVFTADNGSAPQPAMDLLVTELLSLASGPEPYAGLIISLLTETVGSYLSAKSTFISSLRRLKSNLSTLIQDLVCNVKLTEIDGTSGETVAPAILSSWTISLLVALAFEPGAPLKEDIEALTSVRKTLLEAITKALKDGGSAGGLNYGRFWGLGELIQRLLSGSKQREASLQVAKIMLEKNFVGLLTTAIGDIDLNYPGVKTAVSSLLKALEELTKLSVKWSKTTKPQAVVEDDSSSDGDVSMTSVEQVAPDLYRNSALGMLDVMDDDSDDEGDMDEEDDMLDAYDEDMEDLEDESGTEPSTDGDGEMEDDDDPEDWSDDDIEVEETASDVPEVVIGDPDEDDQWEDDEENDSELSQEEDALEEFDDMFDEEEVEFEDDGDDFSYDDYDVLDAQPPPSRGGAIWNWEGPSRPTDRRTLNADRAASALLGLPTRQSNGQLTQPSIMLQSGQNPPPHHTGSSRGDLYAALEGLGGQHAVRLLESLLARSERTGLDAVRISFAQAENGTIDVSIGNRSFNLPRLARPTPEATTQDIAIECVPKTTTDRWAEESTLAPLNSDTANEHIVQHLINRLLPKTRMLVRKGADAQSKESEDAVLVQQDEDMAVSRNTGSSEAAQAAENAESAGTEVAGNANLVSTTEDSARSEHDDGDEHQLGNEQNIQAEQGIESSAALAGTSLPTLARTLVSVRGQDVDITDTGIDLEFLQALPDDMRADVIEQHMREQNRARQPPPVSMPLDSNAISPEFLEALPADIRAEVIMHQAMETSRRPANHTPAVNRFLESLNSDLRDVIAPGRSVKRDPEPRTPHKESVQLLERTGVAALTKLLFFPDFNKNDRLFRIMANLCENGTTRSELLNLLLSVLQDGSGELPVVDRSFQQMSIKTISTPKSAKSKPVDLPAPPASSLFAHMQTDNIPSFIAQRCLEALTHVLATNSRAADFFLTEQDQGVGIKKSAKKGKSKERIPAQTKFPIVILLGLLDRQDLLRTPGLMEHLTALLATVTRPLKAESSTRPPPDTPTPTPVIPAQILRLVVNCLTTGECSSRNFSQTLVVLQNLSSMNDARQVILQELQDRSQLLGRELQSELDSLASALTTHPSDDNEPSLTAFSSPTSNQAQLLRLLKTIEYLHLNKVDSDPPDAVWSHAEKAVSEIFRSFDFEGMWTNLQRCLTLVSEMKNANQNALVLLPVVESLMVICKYRRSKETSPADLFLSFTTHHRKILNAIVRNNPALLSGSFSLLIHNPRVLEFDNKRQWFFQKLRRKKDHSGHSAALHLNVRRQYVFQDSFDALRHKSGEEIKHGKIGVKFVNEDGIDAGGVTREWYSVLAQQIFDPNFALFEPCAADKQTYQPNKASGVNDDHLAYFKFVGRLIGKAVFDGRLLDAYFNRAFYKQILGKTVDMRDLESIDPEYHKSLQWMLDNDITGVIDQEFTIEDDQFGEKKIVELKEGGSQLSVTEENKAEYVRLVVAFRLDNSIKDQIKAFLDGFYEIIPRSLIQIFEPDQLELLISGMSTIDVDELRNSTQLSGWKASDPEVGWFWRALRSFSQEERSRFLMFVTSSSRVPLGGFAQLQGASGTQPFQLQKLYAVEGSLPQASTCFNLLLLPTYSSYEQLRERLQFAVTETGGFGKA